MMILLITVSTNTLYEKMNRDDPDGLKRFQNMSAKIMICNFGSSHGMRGFNYEDINDVECFNFALQGQTIDYDRRLFEYYSKNFEKDTIVFIPVSYHSLFGSGNATIGSEDEGNARYYRILPPNLIKDYDLRTDLYVRYFSSLTAGVDLIRVLSGRSRNTDDEVYPRSTTAGEVESTVNRVVTNHIITGCFDEEGNRIINEEAVASVKYMIKNCRESGFIPILITTPFMRAYTDEVKRLDPGFYDDFYSLIDEISSETDVAYYDYAFDERFVDNYDWFMDSDHLNKEGGRNFTNIVMEEIVKPIREANNDTL